MSPASPENFDQMIVRAAETTAASVKAARAAIGNVIFGQEKVVDHALITVLAGGHALLLGVPGLAKTKLADTMGTVLGLQARRVQFTPDLMPSDIVGAEVLEESASGKRSFRFIQGPVFTQLLLADEINRASPRTQSALLQSMQEYHVTVAGQRHDLPKPFRHDSPAIPVEFAVAGYRFGHATVQGQYVLKNGTTIELHGRGHGRFQFYPVLSRAAHRRSVSDLPQRQFVSGFRGNSNSRLPGTTCFLLSIIDDRDGVTFRETADC